MKDLYKALGLSQNATADQIKKSYRILAFKHHPDRGGDANLLCLINEAYETLYDAERRQQYVINWNAFKEADVDTPSNTILTDGYLHAGSLQPFSSTFRAQHNSSVLNYQLTPLQLNDMQKQSFESSLYRLEIPGNPPKTYHDIFSYIRGVTIHNMNPRPFLPEKNLIPALAIRLFIDFVNGNYYGQELTKLRQYLVVEMRVIQTKNAQDPELLLYEGILDIIVMADELHADRKNLIFSLKKITDFSLKIPDLLLSLVIPLFYNKFFRNLHAYALNLYWQTNEGLFNAEYISQFDGQQEAKELLSRLKNRLSDNNGAENIAKTIQYVKLIYNFEKDLHSLNAPGRTADEYREGGFYLLDWLPVFIEQSNKEVLINIFLQIGIKFQQASQKEDHPPMKMADEQLAFKMYLSAVVIGQNATPDLENYANTHILKYLSAFQFKDEVLQQTIPVLYKRTLIIADIFPFFENHQSNVAFLNQENKMLHLMRHLLNAMVRAHEHNKTHLQSISIDHSTVTILYQAYEACLKNWYQKEYDPILENNFRLELMKELLFDKGWTFLDVEQNIDSPWIMVNRDEDGWMKSSRELPYTDDEEQCVKYRAINGAEINNKTGEISFFMTPWTPARSVYEKVFTLFDLQELLENNITSGIFSLDPVDPDKPYHPYNLMRFSPTKLHETELLNTMLLTDYILKFLTTNQEVQGQYPFDQRSVTTMISHLPEYLQKIVAEFQSAPKSGALHRFWIEAEEIDITLPGDEADQSDVTRIGLGDLKMVVKKHRMERDIHGNLQDIGNEDEGWPIYVLTSTQILELEHRIRVISGPAMIFTHAQTTLIYWDNNQIIQTHIPRDFRDTLVRLFLLPRETNGKIVPNTNNMPLLFRVIKEMAHQTGLAHRFSPEFIFAHQFTTHYNEFAQYLPEFGRLRELSKIASLIRILTNMRESNQEQLQALDFILSNSKASIPDTRAYHQYKQGYEAVCKNVILSFQKWRVNLCSSALQKKWREQVTTIQQQMGTLKFSNHSSEVNQICQSIHDDTLRANPGVSSSRIWREVVEPKRSRLAQELSEAKQKNWRNNVYEAFSSNLLSSLGANAYERLINSFMQGNINPLADALMNHEKILSQQQVSKQFPGCLIRDIALALDDSGEAAASRIAIEEARNQLMQLKVLKTKIESGYIQINLGVHKEDVELKDRCLWVPASVRHDVIKDTTTNQIRYSFFVYGGVSLAPRVNIVPGRNTLLGGNPVGGRSLNNNNAVLYQKVGPDGEHLKFGVTKNPASRYNRSELNGGRLKIVAQGSRQEMLRLERNVHSTLPIGPEERQKGYINIQAAKGYKIPPYK